LNEEKVDAPHVYDERRAFGARAASRGRVCGLFVRTSSPWGVFDFDWQKQGGVRESGRARAYSLAIPPTLERAMHDRRTQSVYDAECD
jgi:hypothetical protein